jgi:hypothetical protein
MVLMNDIKLKKDGYWALIIGIIWVPLTLLAISMMAFLLVASESISIFGKLIVLFFPVSCAVASVANFVYHKHNKYLTEPNAYKFSRYLPFWWILVLLVLSMVLPSLQ